jgi:hypothetical protein
MRNDPYTHFSQQLHNKLTWLVIFYYKKKRKQNKKIRDLILLQYQYNNCTTTLSHEGGPQYMGPTLM